MDCEVLFMIYDNCKEGRFIRRVNRFIGEIEIEGIVEEVHIKNTGRMKELFLPGAEVCCAYVDSAKRKTKYDLISVKKGSVWFNVDSQVPNRVVFEGIRKGEVSELPAFDLLKREHCYTDSRIDIYGEKGPQKYLIEVKGVTYEKDRIAKFPDAPTTRGVKHLHSLIRGVKEGYRSYAFFLLQFTGADYFTPQDERDPLFGETLRLAAKEGVGILVYDSIVKEDAIEIQRKVPLIL